MGIETWVPSQTSDESSERAHDAQGDYIANVAGDMKQLICHKVVEFLALASID